MSKPRKWQWTDGLIRDLRKCHKTGCTDLEAATKLHCRPEVLRNKAGALKLTFRRASFWTKHHIKELQELLLTGISRAHIARCLGTTREQVCAQLTAMNRRGTLWPSNDKAAIRAVLIFDPEASLREICEATACSPVLVNYICGERGKAHTKRCPCAYNTARVARMRSYLMSAGSE